MSQNRAAMGEAARTDKRKAFSGLVGPRTEPETTEAPNGATTTAGTTGTASTTGTSQTAAPAAKPKRKATAAKKPLPAPAGESLIKTTVYLPADLLEEVEDDRMRWQLSHKDWVRANGKVGVSAYTELLLRLGLKHVGRDDEVEQLLRPDGRRPS